MSEQMLERIVTAARIYYEQNATQQEIASALGISRSQVSRYLDKARELGIVTISITLPDSHSSDLECELKKRYPALRDVIVVPFETPGASTEDSLLGRACAKYLMDRLADGMLLGIGAGRAVQSVVNWFRPVRQNIKVVQAMGSTGYHAQGVDYNVLAHEAAGKLDSPLYIINAPTVLWKNTGTVDELIAENPVLAERLQMSKNCNIYLVGVGAIENEDVYVKSGMLDEEDIMTVRRVGAIGNICASFFTSDGSICKTEFEKRIVGVRIDDMANAEYSILVAVGAVKINAIAGVLRGGFVNVLATDSNTAKGIIALGQFADQKNNASVP